MSVTGARVSGDPATRSMRQENEMHSWKTTREGSTTSRSSLGTDRRAARHRRAKSTSR